MLSHCSGFVVTTKHDHLLWEVQFQAVKEHKNFERKNTSIDVVSKEEQICLRNTFRVDNLFEHVNHVIVLSVDVTDDDDGLLHFK